MDAPSSLSPIREQLEEIHRRYRLIDSHRRIKIALLRNIGLSLCRKLRKANRVLSASGH